MSTVRQFLENNESSIGASGAAWDSCNALKQLNRVRSAFYDIGDWNGNTAYICVPCYDQKIYLPWYAENIISASKCNKPITIASSEYFSLVTRACCGKPISVTDNNQYSPVPITNCFTGKLNFRANDALDKNVTVDIAYLNHQGSLISDAIKLEEPFQRYYTSYPVMEIKALSKTSTNGVVIISDCDDNCLFGLSPYYTGRQYRVYCISSGCCKCGEQIVLHVRKAFYAFSNLHYNHLIDFPEHALSLGMEAIAARDLRSTEGIAVYEKLFRFAVQFLKKQKETNVDSAQEPKTNVLNEVSVMEDATYGCG